MDKPVAALELTPEGVAKFPQRQRQLVAEDPGSPPGVLAALAEVTNAEVRLRVARNPAAQRAVITTLAGDADARVRAAAASNPNTPMDVLTSLATDETIRVREGVARNPSSPPETLLSLAQMKGNSRDVLAVQRAVAGNLNCPDEALHILAKNRDARVRESVAGNPNSPVNLLVSLAQDAEIRFRVAKNPNCPLEVLTTLAADPDSLVRSSVAHNPNTPVEVLTTLAADPKNFIRAGAARNPATPPAVLVALVDDPDEVVRVGLAKSSSPDALATLAEWALSAKSDHALRVCTALAANPAAPPDVLARLSKHRSKVVKSLVRENPAFSAPTVSVAEEVKLWNVERREEEAMRSTNPEVLRALQPKASTKVAYRLARNPSTPPDVLDMLADDLRQSKVGGLVAERVADNPSTPDATLRRLAASPNESIRRLVSKNANASEETKVIAAILGVKRKR